MSRRLFELGQRLRAAHTGTPVPVAVYAPALPLVHPVAVELDTDGEHVYLTATDGNRTLSGTDSDGLTALSDLGISLTGTHRTLVVATPADMTTLATLARTYRDHPASPVIGWWDQRADHPGTEAVHIVTTTAALRWTLGVHPDQERDLTTWRDWLGITTTGPAALLELADRTTSGHTLTGLAAAASADTASWERYLNRVAAGRPWHAPDTRIDAALGLASRSHAAEWYDSLRLNDPLVALAASFDGTVVPATVEAVSASELTVRADRPLSRLRVGSEVEASPGEPEDASGIVRASGRVVAASVDTAGQLWITVESLTRKIKGVAVGDRLSLHPARVDPFVQSNGRRLMASMYYRGHNWIAGRGAPVTRRAAVPLDVVVAAAE